MSELYGIHGDRRSHRQIRLVIILFSLGMIVCSQAISSVLEYLMFRFGIFHDSNLSFVQSTVMVGSVSVIIGTLLSLLTGYFILRPFERLLDGMTVLRKGRYDTRLEVRGRLYRRAYSSFNALAGELQSVQILRSDFINNFSHEFKTPLVSMQGLVSLMKSKRLPEEKQKEYLSIIEEEIKRLSMLTTNVLNMTKLDSQSILTDVAHYNLAEQIRTCILLLEKSWSDKSLSLSIELDEVIVYANEDLMKQVVLNLLDNAIKYSPVGAPLGVRLLDGERGICLRIENEGPEIPVEEREKIFSKFYQSDSVGEKKGNGIGLSIVSRIVTLHGGSVRTLREGEMTVFEILLPVS